MHASSYDDFATNVTNNTTLFLEGGQELGSRIGANLVGIFLTLPMLSLSLGLSEKIHFNYVSRITTPVWILY